MRNTYTSLLSAAVIALSASSVMAQRAPGNAEAASARVSRLQTGLTVDVAQPVGAFRDHVAAGVGFGGHGLVRLDGQGALALRFDAGFINNGRDSYRLPLGEGPVGVNVPLDRSTMNNIVSLGIGPQFTTTRGKVRAYANASAGVAFFTTTSSLTGHQDLLNYQYDLTVTDSRFAWTGGAGVLVPLWRRTWTTGLLDIGARYQGNGEGVRYLRKGGVRDLPNGSVQLDIIRGRADFVTWHAGVSMRLR